MSDDPFMDWVRHTHGSWSQLGNSINLSVAMVRRLFDSEADLRSRLAAAESGRAAAEKALAGVNETFQRLKREIAKLETENDRAVGTAKIAESATAALRAQNDALAQRVKELEEAVTKGLVFATSFDHYMLPEPYVTIAHVCAARDDFRRAASLLRPETAPSPAPACGTCPNCGGEIIDGHCHADAGVCSKCPCSPRRDGAA